MATDWRQAGLSSADRALCAYAENLTQTPGAMAEADIAIHDATQIIGYFNYINRIADALGVEVDTFIRPWEQGPR